MSTDALVDTREELNAKTQKLDAIFTAAKGDDGSMDFTKVKDYGLEGDQKARLEAVQALMAEVNDLGVKADEYAKMSEAADRAKRFAEEINGKRRSTAQPIHPDAGGNAAKTLGEVFTASKSFENFARHGSGDSRPVEIDLAKDLGGGSIYTGMKTLMTTAAGFAPESVRSGKIVEYATRPIGVIDTIPGETTSQAAIKYMEETTFTNNAAEASEGAAFGEAALVFTEVTSNVRKIAVWLPVTDEQLEDVPQLQSYINNRLGFMIRQRLDSQILVGDGNAPNLAGLNGRSGVQTHAKGSDDLIDAIRKARTKIRVTGRAAANTVYIHPNDLEPIVLMRTADGLYIMGNPTDDGLERLWGMRVVETDAQTENTVYLKDTTMTGLAIRRNVTVAISNSHGSQFVEGEQAIRCDMRVALQDYRPASGCKVTGA